MSAKINGESGYFEFGTNDLKRFFQWILGCTYEKKTMRTRIAEMFHFAEAPHIIVYERSHESPWWWTVGVILGVLVVVLCLWYTFEAVYRSVVKFFRSVVHEPQSTVSTPRCMSPSKESQKCSPQQQPPASTPSEVRQKIKMNQPVNCVFVKPIVKRVESPLLLTAINEEAPTLKKTEKKTAPTTPPVTPRLDQVGFAGLANVNCQPTMASSPFTAHSRSPSSSNRKSSGKDKEENQGESMVSENGNIAEWLDEQIAGCVRLESERSLAGAEVEVDHSPQIGTGGFLDHINELIAMHLSQEQASLFQSVLSSKSLDSSNSPISSNENISEMSPVPTTNPSIPSEPLEPEFVEKEMEKPKKIESPLNVGKQTIGSEEEADIIIDENRALADTANDCDGSVLVSGSQQKVLFRWTDDHPETVDNVTLTGSFFGWKMNVPMRRSGEQVYEVCMELPEGVHDYLIHVFRFD